MADFNKAIEHVLANEGGFVNDPKDPGGATNFGITLKTYERFTGLKHTPEDVRAMTKEIACLVYKKLYWNEMRLDEINSQWVANCMMDIGVNQGTGRAIGWAQECLRLPVDYQIGRWTIQGINEADEVKLTQFLRNKAVARYETIAAKNRSLRKFLNGWIARADRMLTNRA